MRYTHNGYNDLQRMTYMDMNLMASMLSSKIAEENDRETGNPSFDQMIAPETTTGFNG
jgi:hypothetical protein